MLRVPIMGAPGERAEQARSDELIEFPIRVKRAWWESNDHQHADVLKLTAEWRDVGVDPRLLSSAVVQFYLANADEAGEWTPGPDNLRFVGILVRAQRIAREGDSVVVELEFHDYTNLFLKTKIPQDGIPDYSQTLDDAWRRICDHCGFATPDDPTKIISSVLQLRDRVRPIGALVETWPPTLSRAASSRFSRLAAKVPVKPDADAWAIWQQCVGMCGLISFIRKDECLVTMAQDYYSEKDPPKLVWAHNITSLTESRNAEQAGKGAAVTSFDPLTLTTLEAFYPPRGDEKSATKRAGASDKAVPSEKYDFFAYTGITDQAHLDGLARRIWEERSRQELEGTLTSAEMLAATVSGRTFDLLTLGSGDVIQVEFNEDDRKAVLERKTLTQRIVYLTQRGYAPPVAELMAKNVDTLAMLKPRFCVRRVTVDLQTGSDGSFELQLGYCNRIHPTSGDTGWI